MKLDHYPKSHKPTQHRLTDAEKALALKLRGDGLTQAQIGQRLGVTQSAISLWLAKCEDSTHAARSYLRGQALRMAQKIVAQGKGSDLVATLKGVNVLEEQASQSFSVTINGVVLAGMGQGQLEPVSPLPVLDIGESQQIPEQN